MPKTTAARDATRTAEQASPAEFAYLDSLAERFLCEANQSVLELGTIISLKIEKALASVGTDPEASFVTKQHLFCSGLNEWQESLVALTEKYAQMLKDIVVRQPKVVGAGTEPARWVRSQLEQLLEKALGYKISGVLRHGWKPKVLSPSGSRVLWFFQDVCDPDVLLDDDRRKHWRAPAWCQDRFCFNFELWVRSGKPERLGVKQTAKVVHHAEVRFAMRLNHVLDQIEHEVRIAIASGRDLSLPVSTVTSPGKLETGSEDVNHRPPLVQHGNIVRRQKAKASEGKSTLIDDRKAAAIFLAIEERKRGEDYCRYLHDHYVRTSFSRWAKAGCPPTYPEAYRVAKWRKLIHKEKSRFKAKREWLEANNPREFERILGLVKSPQSRRETVSRTNPPPA